MIENSKMTARQNGEFKSKIFLGIYSPAGSFKTVVVRRTHLLNRLKMEAVCRRWSFQGQILYLALARNLRRVLVKTGQKLRICQNVFFMLSCSYCLKKIPVGEPTTVLQSLCAGVSKMYFLRLYQHRVLMVLHAVANSI